MNDNVKVARITARQQERQAMLDFAEKMVDNPIVEMAAWVMFCQWLRSQQKTNVLTAFGADIEDTALLAAGVGVISCKAIAPAMPMLAQGVGAIAGVIKGVGTAGA